MSGALYIILSILVALVVIVGLVLMTRVSTAKLGNRVSAVAMLLAVILVLTHYHFISFWLILLGILIGGGIGLWMAVKVKMIQMPQMVALLNGIGGAASALVGIVSLTGLLSLVSSSLQNDSSFFSLVYTAVTSGSFSYVTAMLAVIVGMITLSGSLVAAAKLNGNISSKPKSIPRHNQALMASLLLILIAFIWSFFLRLGYPGGGLAILIIIAIASSAHFGYLFSIRVGGADMPITISLLNSLSGVAAGIAGLSLADPLLVIIGGIVGASGLFLTQIMCRAMNRSLRNILIPPNALRDIKAQATAAGTAFRDFVSEATDKAEALLDKSSTADLLKSAKKVVIVPGYGMALAQAQQDVAALANAFREKGAEVVFGIHPVAGRMPGHMNVLLAEANVDYEELLDMDSVNPRFSQTDLVIVVGANDVINPAAKEAEGTPIYGMPVLNVSDARHIIICNLDKKPGYAGVENPLYQEQQKVTLLLGDAAQSVRRLKEDLLSESTATTISKVIDSTTEQIQNIGNNVVEKWNSLSAEDQDTPQGVDPLQQLKRAKSVVIVPGYGMALAQAQQDLAMLGDKLRELGADVKYGIHPVAGRMPGHMNVLLAEANVDYDDLYDIDRINPLFPQTDLVLIVGANDVVNPAAREAEGTPIYGMPILEVDKADYIIICNYDKAPGYAGVENPLYHQPKKVHFIAGDAKATVSRLYSSLFS